MMDSFTTCTFPNIIKVYIYMYAASLAQWSNFKWSSMYSPESIVFSQKSHSSGYFTLYNFVCTLLKWRLRPILELDFHIWIIWSCLIFLWFSSFVLKSWIFSCNYCFFSFKFSSSFSFFAMISFELFCFNFQPNVNLHLL